MEKILNQASKDLLYSSQMWKPFQYGASLQGGSQEDGLKVRKDQRP